jgi:hypothetical protein
VYEGFREAVDWARLLAPGQTFSIESRVWSCSNLTSSQLLLVRGRDAVCDAVRDARGVRPVPPEPGRVADVPLYCTAYQDRLTLYRDMSGASLHRRGYRQAMHRAALNEAAAAGILRLAGWGERCKQEGAGGRHAAPHSLLPRAGSLRRAASPPRTDGSAAPSGCLPPKQAPPLVPLLLTLLLTLPTPSPSPALPPWQCWPTPCAGRAPF